ncbi:MAG: hypothetical protein RIQ52_2092 [Pseudomonadota bacterium]
MNNNSFDQPASQETADSCLMIIFGATGDLTRRKLLPALYNLAVAGLLPEGFAVMGAAFDALDTESFRQRIREAIHEFIGPQLDEKIWSGLESRIFYLQGDFRDADYYQRIKQEALKIRTDFSIDDHHFYYLATAHGFFDEIIQQLGRAGLAQEYGDHWRRVIIEKPFGHDLASAQQLNQSIREVLHEHQIYRIDHYLGKETVQNIMVFRFANSIFEPIWNRRYIDHVQITAAETVGVEMRGDYYETAGALRDMVPNHLFQLLSLTAMEPPISFEADAVRDEQTKVLRAIQVPTPEEVLGQMVRGQYAAGNIGGESVAGYREEPRVAAQSGTETFVAMKLNIDNWRWAGVPFYLRTGKRLPKRVTEIAIQFRQAPLVLFRNTHIDQLQNNRLVMHLQPNEGISLQFGVKEPGTLMKLGDVRMDFQYNDYFGKQTHTGYERLLHDCMTGDATLFQRADMVEAGWNVIQPLLDVWGALPPRSFPNYKAGSWGPDEADALLRDDGNRRWINTH